MQLRSCLFAFTTTATATAAQPACTTGPAGTPSADPTVVTIQTGAPPALIAFRDEDSAAWRPLDPISPGTFEVSARGPYRVLVVCATASSRAVSVMEYARTPEDGGSIVHGCYAARPLKLSGHMPQAGGVCFGDVCEITNEESWDFQLPAHRGSFDLVLFTMDLTTADRDMIAIRRDLALDRDLSLGEIDLFGAHPQPLIPLELKATGLRPGEWTSSTMDLDTGTTVAAIDERSGWLLKVAPDSALLPTDRQIVSLSAELPDPTWTRSQYREVTHDIRLGVASPLALPAPIESVTFTPSVARLDATWSELPAHDEILLRRLGATTFEPWRLWLHQAALSRAFLDATGATSAALDFRDVPGFKPEWIIDPAIDQMASLYTKSGAWPERATSGVLERLRAAPAAGAARAADSDPAAPGPRLRSLLRRGWPMALR